MVVARLDQMYVPGTFFMTATTSDAINAADISSQKQELLLAFYQTSWNEMTWRRNAGYRTIILGLGYFAVILTIVAFQPQMPTMIRISLGGVIAIGTLFGAGYLSSNYRKYMAAAAQTVLIEEYLGAYDQRFLGNLGALMPGARRERPKVPLSRDPVCLWSVIAFFAGGLLTAAAILLI
jgi:hypothetical protein